MNGSTSPGKVALLHQQDAPTRTGGFQRDTSAGDATTHHHQVPGLARRVARIGCHDAWGAVGNNLPGFMQPCGSNCCSKALQGR